jgi:hypothetical protein
VQLDRLAVQLRLRNPWEAMDLGFAMVRSWLGQIYAPWLALFVPVCAVALFALPRPWAWVAVWWLKPAFDRVILHVLSNGVFGALPSWRQTLRALPGALRPGLLLSLTLYRLDFARSFNLPVWQLERQGGRAARARAKQLQRRTRGYAVWLTIACLHFESLLWLSAVALLDLLAPANMDSEFDFLSLFSMQQLGSWREYLVAGMYFLAVTVVEPLYVAGGFALYLNRRTALEGWDLEVQLRRMGERLREWQRALAAGTVLGVAIAIGGALLALPAPAQAQEGAPARLAPDTPAAREIKHVLQRPELQEYDTRTVLVYLGKKKKAEPRDTAGFGWLDSVAASLASLLRAVAWVLLGIAVAFLVYLLARHFDLRGIFSRRRGKRYAPPDTVFGLDVRPESLPQDLVAEALRLARAGDLLKALSLLYRGTLITLLHRDGLELTGGDTEDDCLRKSAHRIPDPAYAYFATLLTAWQRLAYARRPVAVLEVEALCTGWEAHFKR